MRAAFATLGCKVNHYETQAMEELFLQAGWEIVDFPHPADVYVINTCTVTSVSDGKSRQLIARAHRANPSALIAVAGCYAQTAPEEVLALPGVGLAVGTDGRKEIVEKVVSALSGGGGDFVTDIRKARVFEPLSAVRDGRTRATLKIQDGCVNFCSYCAIPYARGPLRSRPLEDIRRELERLGAEGYREVVLTGIHLASYGLDLTEKPNLLDALALTDDIPGIRRVRLGSLEPRFVDERFAAVAARNEKLCRQFHLSLQSGADTVLTRMKRRYTTAEYARSVALLREAMPGCAVTTDVIAGFCGETEEEHAASMAFCREMAFARMHVFPFSLRKGTAAASMPEQLQKSVKERRARELIALGRELTGDYLRSQLGTVQQVLAESGGQGYTGSYIHVKTQAPEGTIVTMELTGFTEETAEGKELKRE